MNAQLPNPVIRTARPNDSAELAHLFDELGYPAGSAQFEARLMAVLASEDHALLVADAGSDRLAGCIHGVVVPILENDLTLQIMAMFVREEHRRRGLGRRLVEALEAWGTARNCAVTYVRCNVKRSEAHRFWEATGFSNAKTQFAFRKRLGPVWKAAAQV